MNLDFNLTFEYNEYEKYYNCTEFEQYVILCGSNGDYIVMNSQQFYNEIYDKNINNNQSCEAIYSSLEEAKCYIKKEALVMFYNLTKCFIASYGEIPDWRDDFKSFVGDTKRNKKHILPIKTYILSFGSKIKIGKSIRPEKRINDVGNMAGCKIEKYYIFDSNIESELHQYFKKYRTIGEYFEGISFDEIITTGNSIHRRNKNA